MKEVRMERETMEKVIARRSASIYIPITLGAVVLFLLATFLIGDYPLVARIGGAVWIGLLMMIVTMPVITAEVKKRLMHQELR
jgi:peptidoglycan/LPS O-acetylase OafA/YrhL